MKHYLFLALSLFFNVPLHAMDKKKFPFDKKAFLFLPSSNYDNPNLFKKLPNNPSPITLQKSRPPSPLKNKYKYPLSLKQLCINLCQCPSTKKASESLPTEVKLAVQFNIKTTKKLNDEEKQELLNIFFNTHSFENYYYHRRIFLALSYAGAFDVQAYNRIAKVALETRDHKLLEFILSQGIDPNSPSEFHTHYNISLPLFFLATTPAAMQICIDNGADFQTAIDDTGNTILHHLATKESWGSEKIQTSKRALLDFCLQEGALINQQNNNGDTPLHQLCVSELDLNIIQTLLIHNANIFIENKKGETPKMLLEKRKNNLPINGLLAYATIKRIVEQARTTINQSIDLLENHH